MSAKTLTILVAEDSEEDAFVLRKAFEKTQLPYGMTFVSDGQQAIHYLEGKPPYNNRAEFPAPDLLLLDLKMPIASGFDVLRWMQLSGLDNPPVLVLSGSNLVEDKSLAMALGAREYHEKTGQVETVIEFLKSISDRWLKASLEAKS